MQIETASGRAEAADRSRDRIGLRLSGQHAKSEPPRFQQQLLSQRAAALEQREHRAGCTRRDPVSYHRMPPGIRGAAQAVKNKARSKSSPARHAIKSMLVTTTNCGRFG